MTVIFECEDFRVSNGFFKGWRVEDLRSGQVVIPSAQLRDRVNLVWPSVRSGRVAKMSPPGRWAEDVLFLIFGMSALQPKSGLAIDFCGMPMEELENLIARQANVNKKVATGTF